MQVNLLIAFSAGLASFLAPCVLPLLPAYVSFISGVSFSELTKTHQAKIYRQKVFLNSLLYTAGFSIVFILLGLASTQLGRIFIINRTQFLQIGGVVIILFGLYTLGVFNRFRFIQKEYRVNLSAGVKTLKGVGPFLLGVTFALAWTPCVGAILGSILTLAAASTSVQEGAFLLFIYSLGISVPFLLVALTISRSYALLNKLGRGVRYVSFLAGVILIIIGVLMVTQYYQNVVGVGFGGIGSLGFFKSLQSLG